MAAWQMKAQDEIQIRSVEMIPMGDGTNTYRDFATKKHLEGAHRIIFDDSEYVVANFKNGLPDGSWEKYRYNKLKEKSTYLDGRLTGTKIEYFSDGVTVFKEFHLKNGKLDGRLVEYYTDGQICKDEMYKEGVEHGAQKKFDQTGKLTSDRFFQNGKAEGKQMIIWSSNIGDFITYSNCVNGLRHGEYVETFLSGSIRKKGVYKNGEEDGVWIENFENGKPKSFKTYKNGVLNGDSKTYFNDGSIERLIPYVNDQKEGASKEYYFGTNVLKSEIAYTAGKENGTYKLFYDDGKVREEGRAEQGTRVSTKEYYRNGQLKAVKERQGGAWETIESYSQDGKQL